MTIGIVIPAFNEHKNIVKIIKEIKKNIKCFIVVVDDSTNLKTKNIYKKIFPGKSILLCWTSRNWFI